jgi:hypothetical protein
MALFMDVHNHIPGLTKDAVAGAHQKDLETQGKHGVKYLQYWFKESAIRVHRDGHGLVADEITEVVEGR